MKVSAMNSTQNLPCESFHPLQNYKMLSLIGEGSFAKVVLARSKMDGMCHAVKIIDKAKVVRTGFSEQQMTEKAILSYLEHPFIIKLKESFQDASKLYFVMEYCPGGELLGLLSLKGRLPEDPVKFYACQIILALEKLHENKLIYRDLKPENVLIDSQGNVKLVDFGLSKALLFDQKKTDTVCGTPEYMAPEMIRRTGHDQSVDWWELGCLLYQMAIGVPAFSNPNPSILYNRILYQNPQFPPTMSPLLRDLIEKLLTKDPKQRLGFKGASEVRKHPWFDCVNWDVIQGKQMRAPYVPIIESDSDVSNFDDEFTKKSCSDLYGKILGQGKEDDTSIDFPGFQFSCLQ